MPQYPFLVNRKDLSSTYHFRSIISIDLRQRLGMREFQISLKSSSLRTARGIALRLYTIIQGLYQKLKLDEMEELTVSEIKEILKIEVR